MFGIDPKPAPQELDDAFRAIFGVHAGTPEFEKSLVRMAGEQRRDVELGLTVKAAVTRGNFPAQQAIGADYLGLRPAEGVARRLVDDDEMIADLVEAAEIAPNQRGAALRDRLALFVEDLIAQPLRLADLLLRRRKTDFERAAIGRERPRRPAYSAPSRAEPLLREFDDRAEVERRIDVPHCFDELLRLGIMNEARSGGRIFDDVSGFPAHRCNAMP